jgi:hypothetical protein
VLVGKIQRPCFSPVFHLLRHWMSAGFANRCRGGRIRMTRIRLIMGLITPHRAYLTSTKTRKGRPGPDPGCSATDDDDDDGHY